MEPWRKSEWVRCLAVLDLRWRSMPRLSPAAPSSVKRTIAKALRRSSLSRRCGSEIRRTPIPMPKRRSLVSRNPGSIVQRLAVVIDDFARARLGVAGGQAPGFLHVFGVDADDGAHFAPARGDRGGGKFARPTALADPVRGEADLAIGRRDMDIAAEPDDIVKAQFVEKGEQLDVAEAAIGQDRDGHALGQRLGAAEQTGLHSRCAYPSTRP